MKKIFKRRYITFVMAVEINRCLFKFLFKKVRLPFIWCLNATAINQFLKEMADESKKVFRLWFIYFFVNKRFGAFKTV